MTRTGARKPVGAGFGESRLRIAKAFHTAAERQVRMSEGGDIANPAVSLIISATVAYADALTARFAGVVSQGEHAAAAKVLRDSLGNRLPAAQERAFKRILDRKHLAQYGSRILPASDAAALLGELDTLARWVVAEMDRAG